MPLLFADNINRFSHDVAPLGAAVVQWFIMLALQTKGYLVCSSSKSRSQFHDPFVSGTLGQP